MNPLAPFLNDPGFVILDGGLATHLEALGADLDSALWSARMLLEDPGLIRQAHLDFLEAGADCITTASYQATLPGLTAAGLSETDATRILSRSVELAREVRDSFVASNDPSAGGLRNQPLVAASVGPYGAYLANGAEYTGQYDIAEEDLYAFHRKRWQILASAGPDLMACETVPAKDEARVFARLLRENPDHCAWVSFTTNDGRHIADGTPLDVAMAPLASIPNVVALGINCSSPDVMLMAIEVIAAFSNKPVIVYPNSGEQYAPETRTWTGDSIDFGQSGRQWKAAGARLIGGCCRTTPSTIHALRHSLSTAA